MLQTRWASTCHFTVIYSWFVQPIDTYIKWNEIFLYLVPIPVSPCNSISVLKLFRTSWGRSENLHFFFCSVLLFFFFPSPKREVICFNLWKWVLRTIKLRMDSFLNLGYRGVEPLEIYWNGCHLKCVHYG